MQSFTFQPGPAILSGPGAAALLADKLDGPAGGGPCLFVTDRDVVALGLTDPLRAALAARGIEVILFDAVEADPSRATLMRAVAAGAAAGVRQVVGFGGGSPMDVAKLAAYLLGSGDDLDTLWGVGLAKGVGLPLALVPTTAGTGSEATPVAVITCEGEEKRGVNSPALMARWTALDAGLTVGMPRGLTAATGIDAMVHAIEAYTSARAKNPYSDLHAREALRLLSANLLRACTDPGDLAARSAMLLGAHLAGIAFANAPVGGVHALAYPLGGIFHLPHGLSNALMLRAVLEHNSAAARDLYAELAPILVPGCDGQGSQAMTRAFIDRMEALVVEAGIAPRLRDHGVERADLGRLAREAMKQQRLLVNNPCPIDEADAARLYEAAW